jgi:hypothetical protein
MLRTRNIKVALQFTNPVNSPNTAHFTTYQSQRTAMNSVSPLTRTPRGNDTYKLDDNIEVLDTGHGFDITRQSIVFSSSLQESAFL